MELIIPFTSPPDGAVALTSPLLVPAMLPEAEDEANLLQSSVDAFSSDENVARAPSKGTVSEEYRRKGVFPFMNLPAGKCFNPNALHSAIVL
jgi:hypothetical protein